MRIRSWHPFFLNKSTSVAIGDNCLAIYKGGEVPKESSKIMIDKEIKSTFHNSKYIGMILKNEGKEGYELRLYNAGGKMAMSEDFTGDYKNVKSVEARSLCMMERNAAFL